MSAGDPDPAMLLLQFSLAEELGPDTPVAELHDYGMIEFYETLAGTQVLWAEGMTKQTALDALRGIKRMTKPAAGVTLRPLRGK